MSESWHTHRFLYRIIMLDVEYVALEPLRIGAGRGSKLESPIDLPVIRIKYGGNNVPYLPGSSIKGVFRAGAEYLARSAGLSVCERGEGCRKQFDRDLQSELKKGNVIGALKLLKENYCPICQLFGTGTYKSHLDFYNAFPADNVSLDIKTGVAIDRRSGVAKKGALYIVEYINPGSVFHGGIRLYNVPNYGVGLMAEVIEMVNRGFIKFGGMKSRGFGRLKVDIKNINIIQISDGVLSEVRSKMDILAMDEMDSDIVFDPGDQLKFLEECREAWIRYVSKKKG